MLASRLRGEKNKIAFVTNYCPHYRIRTFETLARHHDADYYFFSEGSEWYWQAQHGVYTGNFRYEYLPGFRLGQTRVTPMLPRKLWQGGYDAYVKCINGRFALPITYAVARMKQKPFVLWTGIWSRLDTPAHRLFFPFTRYIYCHADAIVVYGEHVKRYLIAEGVSPERIFVTTHAVDNRIYSRVVTEEEKVVIRRQLQISSQQKIVLYLGRLEEGKGLSHLVSAFASLQRDDSVLVMAGAGSQKSVLESMAAQAGLADRIRFPGYIPTQETVPYYSLAWVYVLPSVTTPVFKEPWGLVVNEAFNQGVPVIATDAVGAAAGGLVEHGVNGFIVPEQNPTALADAIRLLLDYPELRQQFSNNARQKIATWDNEHMVQGFLDAIQYVSTAS